MRRIHFIAGALVVVALIAGGSVAWATIPDSSGMIHGCYKKSGGALRVINAPAKHCKASEKAIGWSAGSGPHAYIARMPPNALVTLTNFVAAQVVSLDLPEGTYAISAAVNVNNQANQPTDANCNLSTGAHAHSGLFANGGGAAMTLVDTASLPGGSSIVLSCGTLKGIAFGGVIMAIAVNGVN